MDLNAVDIEFEDAHLSFVGRIQTGPTAEFIGVLDEDKLHHRSEDCTLEIVKDGVVVTADGARDVEPGLYRLTSDGLQRVDGESATDQG